MSEIVRVVEEEFDDEGNLVRRVTTEYVQEKPKYAKGGPITTLPTLTGQVYTVPDDYLTYSVNLRETERYDVGSFHSHPVGGTDRTRSGEYVGPYGVGPNFGE